MNIGIALIMEKHMKKKVENYMETGYGDSSALGCRVREIG